MIKSDPNLLRSDLSIFRKEQCILQAMDVTVVIPCFNEEAYLPGLLENLNAQTKKPKQIVVADCDSNDKTREVAKKFVSKTPIKVTMAPYKSASSARNAGAKLAKTEYLLFIDADTRIPANFVQVLMEQATKQDLDFLSPRFKSDTRHPLDALNIGGINLWLWWLLHVRHKPMGIGTALLVRKRAHDQIGGFNEYVREFDDIAYSKKFSRHSHRFGLCRSAVAIFSHRRAIREGRVKTAMQQLPDDYYLVRKLVRPAMKRTGIKEKFHED